MDRERDEGNMKGRLKKASFMLQVVSDILDNEFFEGPVEILFSAIDSPHVTVLDELAVLAASEAEGEIGAGEAILIFPVIEPVGSAAATCAACNVTDAAFFSADHAGALVECPVVIYDEAVVEFHQTR
jgi:hypothetical protein